jgi:hypothetical protein
MADGAMTIPTNVTTKADFDKWLDNEVGDKLTTTQKNALKTDISAKLGLDMGNAITAYGRTEINKDLQYLFDNPTAKSIPQLDSDPKVGDANGPNQFNSLWARANNFSDPFLIDLTSVLALMHQTSEKLRSATKELREAENQNSQAQMQAAAEDIKSQGQFQAIAGAIGAGMSIASGATGLASTGRGMSQVKDLHTDVKSMKTESANDWVKGTGPESSSSTPKLQMGEHRQSTTSTSTDKSSKTTESTKKTVDLDKQNLQTQLNELKAELKSKNLTEGQYKKAVNDAIQGFSGTKFQEIQMISQHWQSYGQMLDGVGKAFSSSLQGVASGYESDKALKDKQAAQAQHEKDQTNDLIKTLSDFSQQIRQTVAAIIQSQDQAANRVANV